MCASVSEREVKGELEIKKRWIYERDGRRDGSMIEKIAEMREKWERDRQMREGENGNRSIGTSGKR